MDDLCALTHGRGQLRVLQDRGRHGGLAVVFQEHMVQLAGREELIQETDKLDTFLARWDLYNGKKGEGVDEHSKN